MICWHVTSAKKLARYLRAGQINPPVRAWRRIEDAQQMSLGSGRRIILRLRFPDDAKQLPGHRGVAVYTNQPIAVEGM
jgi:hypothetical protein